MPDRWKRFVNPEPADLIGWFIEDAAEVFERGERSIGLAIAKVAEIFVTHLESGLESLRSSI